MAHSTGGPNAPHYLSTLLQTGKYSDLTIKCGSETFRVHKNIVCMQSKVLAAMIDGDFLESKTSVINLVEDDPETVNRLLQFFYTSDYDDCNDRHAHSSVLPHDPIKTLQSSIPSDSPTKMYLVTIKNFVRSIRSKTLRHIHSEIMIVVDGEEIDACRIISMCPLTIEIVVSSEETANKIVRWYHSTITNGPTNRMIANYKLYDSAKESSIAPPASMEVNTMVYIIADKYDVPGLKDLAVQKNQKSIAINWQSDYFCSSLKLLYENTVSSDMDLKRVFLTLARSRRSSLVYEPQFAVLLEETGEIGFGLYKEEAEPMISGEIFETAICCSKKDCVSPISCSKCKHKYFSHIDWIVRGAQVDYRCGNLDCDSTFAIEDLASRHCDDHMP